VLYLVHDFFVLFLSWVVCMLQKRLRLSLVADKKMGSEETSLSLLASFDSLCRNAEVLFQAGEQEFVR
jgi:hypothetical protein